MKTLCIHPRDRTTDFLKLIYKDKDWTIINDPDISNEDLVAAIKAHDRIIMMGHGLPGGLLNPKRFGYLINSSHVPLLKTKQTVSIWCYSSDFFDDYNIHDGNLHTGMVISEVGEALGVLGECPFTEEEMLENMNLYAKTIGECIDMPFKEAREYFLEHYNGTDSVSRFNRATFTSR